MTKKISVIIPVYNTEEFLQECVASVLRQTYRHLEVLLINDGSAERCTRLINDLVRRDDRLTCLHFKERKGVGAARNAGIEKASGDYVYFLDSDDYLPEATLEQMIAHIGDAPMLSGNMTNVTKRAEHADTSQEPRECERIVYKEDKAFPFKNRSALHRLIAKDFIDRHALRFSEDVTCYADLAFIVPAMMHMEDVPVLKGCVYYRRLRNDPITNPSLMQLDKEQRIGDFLTIYRDLRRKYGANRDAADYLDRRFLNFYESTIFLFLNRDDRIRTWFGRLCSAAQQVDVRILRKRRFIVQWEMSSLRQQNRTTFTRRIRIHHKLRTLRRALRGRNAFYIQLYRSLFMRLPMKEKRIVFESFLGKNYACNPKYMYEWMLNARPDFNYVWVFNETGRQLPGKAKQVKRFSLAYYYYLATAKYWVSNSRMPKHLGKRAGNIYVQTWHGTPLKKLVFDMDDIHLAQNHNYKKHFYEQSRRWDYLLSPNPYSSKIFRRAFKYDKELLECGYPRNDLLYRPDREQLAASIKQSLGLPPDKKVILYAPTWRDDEYYARGKYKFQLKLDLQKMKERLEDEYVVVLKVHYLIADHVDTGGLGGFAHNLSQHDDIAELYLISDVLITDYSSVFFDYANLKRPILFYTYDLEKYRDTLRGFYLNIEEEVPGPLLQTTEAVVDAIERIDEVQAAYKEKYDAFYNTYCCWEDGKAAERVVKHIFP